MLSASRIAYSGLILLVAVGSACGGTGEEPAAPAAGPASAASPALQIGQPVHHLDTTAREPMLVQHPDGTLFVAGYQRENPVVEQPPALWRSDDGGVNWQRVDVGTVQDGAVGNSDVDLAIAPDGTIYFLTMGFDRTVSEGTHVVVGVSRDVGESWQWTLLTRAPRVDRPWIVIAPNGAAHVVWNDGSGVFYTASRDGGDSWAEPRRLVPRGGSSHMAVGPAGELAVRVSPISASGAQMDPDAEWILLSFDGGETWDHVAPPGTRTYVGLGEEGVQRWVEPLAWDADGALYYLWSEGSELWLARSQDRGASWHSSVVLRDDETMYFPYLVARGSGELAATWFSGDGESLAAHVALIDASAGGAPQLVAADAFQPHSWAPGDPPTRDAAGEYVPVAFLADGDLGVATPVQDPAARRFGFTFWRISVD